MSTISPPTATAKERRRASRSPVSPATGRDGDFKTAEVRDMNGVRPRRSADDSSYPPTANAQSTPALKKPQQEPVDNKFDASDATRRTGHLLRGHLRSPWACSPLTLGATLLAFALVGLIAQSFLGRQLDSKGCAMCYMRPAFAKFADFDTEHTRFAPKYSLYLYREGGIDEDTRVKGVPVLFIPGNAGSYKQVRPLAAEAAYYFHNVFSNDPNAAKAGKRPLDFFSVDFNEDITAFHGQTLLDQAEYLNEAIAYILALYHNPNRSMRDPELPDPSSVVLVGHSMGGVVARTMLTLPNYRANSINTILTLAAPHARAPVSFDADVVYAYERINTYWRDAYSQASASNNPLQHVTLVSIAGGGLDAIVPSDYSTIASLVPPTHGFTVFTSSIPTVWTSMDHLAITWCDQLRKGVIRALYGVIDANHPNQTRPWAHRMSVFKKQLLTGMEDISEKTFSQAAPQTLLTLDDSLDAAIISQGERLILRSMGESRKAKAYLLPIPPHDPTDDKIFTLMTDQKLDEAGEHGQLEVMFCSVFPLHTGQSAQAFPTNMDLSGDGSGQTRLACRNAASDVVLLPASYPSSQHAFDGTKPFSYLQYNLDELLDHQIVAVVDKSTQSNGGWVVAEFASKSDSFVHTDASSSSLLHPGLEVALPSNRTMMTEIKMPSVHSSLLAYKVSIRKQSCSAGAELFSTLLRQHIADPYESKYFVNVQEAEVNLHGVSPYIPPSLGDQGASRGLSLQIWTDPSCNSAAFVSMRLDILGSMGKLWMRYRMVFAAFPLIVVALVLRKQFKLYDQTGIFMSFTESMDQCLRTSVPLLLLGLTLLALSISRTSQALDAAAAATVDDNGVLATATDRIVDYARNDLLLGSQDPFFCFLIPMFGLISIGICIVLNYLVLTITHGCALLHTSLPVSARGSSRFSSTFAVASLRKRVVTVGVLLLLVSTVIPYQFVFIVLCVVQVATCVRALNLARESDVGSSSNFYNYAHSVLLLMLWILPINIPVLVVWIHNLSVHWLTPFSSHHNVLAITPFVMLVEALSTGNMVPRVTTWFRQLTALLLFGLAVYAGVYGVTYAYRLHWIANVLSAWLVGAHLWGYYSTSKTTNKPAKDSADAEKRESGLDTKKRP